MSDTQAVTWPLTTGQSGVWFAQQLDPSNPAHRIAECLEIHGPVDPVLFEAALRQLLVETEMLRLRFPEQDGQVRQTVAPLAETPVLVHDVSDQADPWAAVRAWIEEDLARLDDLAHGRTSVVAMFPAGPDRLFWYQRAHHLAGDGYSGALLAGRAAEIYTALVEGRPTGTPFAPTRSCSPRRRPTEPVSSTPPTAGTGPSASPTVPRRSASPAASRPPRTPTSGTPSTSPPIPRSGCGRPRAACGPACPSC